MSLPGSSMSNMAPTTYSPLATLNTSQQVATVPTFQGLPIELRRKIWNKALPGPRIIQIQGPTKEDSDAEEYLPNAFRSLGLGLVFRQIGQQMEPRASTDVPALLHVCQEAREIALNEYKLVFGDVLPFPFYISSVDIVWCKDFSFWNMLGLFDNLPLDTIVHVALSTPLQTFLDYATFRRKVLSLPKLKTVFFVHKEDPGTGNFTLFDFAAITRFQLLFKNGAGAASQSTADTGLTSGDDDDHWYKDRTKLPEFRSILERKFVQKGNAS